MTIIGYTIVTTVFLMLLVKDYYDKNYKHKNFNKFMIVLSLCLQVFNSYIIYKDRQELIHKIKDNTYVLSPRIQKEIKCIQPAIHK
jgi:hypothetical protein